MPAKLIKQFNRHFLKNTTVLMRIGGGEIGGKAHGLLLFHQLLQDDFIPEEYPGISVSIPNMVLLTTDIFDKFMEHNKLYTIALSDASDMQIAQAFQRAELPTEIIGDLYTYVQEQHRPVAVRSSSLLEDSLEEPFAGVYITKMVPNNHNEIKLRFEKLREAIKLVYASTFFEGAKAYLHALNKEPGDDKMAVILQEVVGNKQDYYFYPHISGVARSYNFYPTGKSKPEDGIVELALGLGKLIVDEGIAWRYCPSYPHAKPPYSSDNEMLKKTQLYFWAINMLKPFVFDPVKETEYLVQADIKEAEYQNTLRYLASTYMTISDRVYPGISSTGPRIINFAPILNLKQLPLNDLILTLMKHCENKLKAPVEIEFAASLDNQKGVPAHFGCLQVRPMRVDEEQVSIELNHLHSKDIFFFSEMVLGNGRIDHILDIVYVKPDQFSKLKTRTIANEIAAINRKLIFKKQFYLLIGFGRWGSSDSYLGIPVKWEQICGAKAIIEVALPEFNVEFSQGTHFFHNMTGLHVLYFSAPCSSEFQIDWQWLTQQREITDSGYVRHVQLTDPLLIQADGRNRHGVILKKR
jgi:hypothetical protein